MNRKQVVLVANIPDLVVNQKNSAVYNYLTYLTTLSSRADVDIAVFPPKIKSKNQKAASKGILQQLLIFVLRPIPKLKKTISDYILIKKQDQFVEELFKHYPNPDGVLEFYFYGSRLYKEVKKRNLPFTVFFDCPVYDQSIEVTNQHSFYKKEIDKRQLLSLEMANQIIGYSDPVREFIVKKYKVSRSKIRVFPTFIPDNGIGKDLSYDNRHYIGFIGSFLSWHKVELLIGAFEQIANQLPKRAKLVLIGKGEEWERIKHRVEASPQKSRIELTGYVSLSELREWRKKIRIGVMPGSNWYGSPLKLFEYLFAGIPFIAPKTPTVTYIFRDRKDCLIIDDKNPQDSLANHILELYSSVNLRKQFSENALDRMKTTFSEENLIKILNKIVED